MNLNKGIGKKGIIGGDYFSLGYDRSVKVKLDYYLNQFNFDDYYCFKATRHQREVSYNELLEFKYSKYLFLRKDKYNIDHINLWIDWLSGMRGIQFINIPFPPFHPNKIIIK